MSPYMSVLLPSLLAQPSSAAFTALPDPLSPWYLSEGRELVFPQIAVAFPGFAVQERWGAGAGAGTGPLSNSGAFLILYFSSNQKPTLATDVEGGASDG